MGPTIGGAIVVALYVDGAKVGVLADAERLIPELLGQAKLVELRDEPTGRRLGTLTPEALWPWEPELTREEALRRIAEPGGMTLAEFRARMRKA
jgi:hypothetical protein